MVALVPIVVFGVLLAVVTVPFVSLGPGPTFDTLGEVDGKQVVQIEGTQTHPTTGHLNMTTVSQRDGLSLGEALTLWLSGQEQLVPRDLVYPPGKSREEVDNANSADFKNSEESAEYAALEYLKYPDAVTVATVSEPGPSAGKLKAGDAIDAVNGTAVANVEQFTSILKDTKPGDVVVIDFRRKNEAPGVAQITLGTNKDRDYGFMGVAVLDAPWAPFVVDFPPRQRGRPLGRVDVQSRRGGQTDHRRSGRFDLCCRHRNDHRRRQGRPHRRHHPQDGGGPGRRRLGIPGAGQKLLRGGLRYAQRPSVGEGRNAGPSGGRIARHDLGDSDAELLAPGDA